MKLKLKKLTIESMGISVLLATMLTVCVAFLSLMGWGVLWGVLVAVLYQVNKCRHMTEFVEKLMEKTIEEEPISSINEDPYW